MRTSNPTLKEKIFESVSGAGVMTLDGTMAKTSILLVLMIATAAYGWAAYSMPLLLVGIIGGLGLGLATSFKPNWAPITAPLYALFEGLAVGTISALYNSRMADTKYAGAVPLAVVGTFAVLAVMVLLYVTRIIKVNKLFMSVVVGATLAIAVTYFVTFFGGMFIPGLRELAIFKSGPIGIGFSIGVIVLASLNLALDLSVIETGINSRAPKFMEWYAGYGLLVTLVWLYLEILRLLSKLSKR